MGIIMALIHRYFTGELAGNWGSRRRNRKRKTGRFCLLMTVDEPLGACEMEGVADDDDVDTSCNSGTLKAMFSKVLSDLFSMWMSFRGMPMSIAIDCMVAASVAAVAVRAAAHQQSADFVLAVEGDACFYRERRQGLGLLRLLTELPKMTAMSAGLMFWDAFFRLTAW